MAFFMTFFSIFNIPVFWPILLLYFIALFVLTMKRQIKHMIKCAARPLPGRRSRRRVLGGHATATTATTTASPRRPLSHLSVVPNTRAGTSTCPSPLVRRGTRDVRVVRRASRPSERRRRCHCATPAFPSRSWSCLSPGRRATNCSWTTRPPPTRDCCTPPLRARGSSVKVRGHACVSARRENHRDQYIRASSRSRARRDHNRCARSSRGRGIDTRCGPTHGRSCRVGSAFLFRLRRAQESPWDTSSRTCRGRGGGPRKYV